MGAIFSHLLVTLLAGFYLSVTVPSFRYRSYRHGNYWNLLYAVLYGFAATVVAAASYPILLRHFDSIEQSWPGVAGLLSQMWSLSAEVIPIIAADPDFRVEEASLLALWLSAVGGTIAWQLGRVGFIRRWSQRRALRATGDPLELLFDRAITHGSLVQVTLQSGKVYVGYVEATLDPSVPRKNVKVLPYLSGSRREGTHEVDFTTDYAPFLKVLDDYAALSRRERRKHSKVKIDVGGETVLALPRERFIQWTKNYGVVVPWESIAGATIWDPTLHSHFSGVSPVRAGRSERSLRGYRLPVRDRKTVR